MKHLPALLLGGCSLWALAGSAFAQSASQQTPAASPQRADQSIGVQEIVVTAQKRAQRLQDVPVAVSVVSGDLLKAQGVTDATQLQYTTPELTFTAGPSPAYAIRGIGTQTFSRTASSDVSIVVDGVIQGQPRPPTNSLVDVARVEILSGPQGMLFGKNASAGVINVVTNAPDPRAFSATAHADVGQNGYQVYQGTVNMPISERSALRVSLFSDGEGAVLHNVATDKGADEFTDYGGRARYLFWTDRVKVDVTADYEKDNGGAQEWSSRVATTLAPLLAACGVKPGPYNTNVCLDGPSSATVESYGVSTQIDIPLGGYTLTSITADRQYVFDGNIDSDSVNRNFLSQNSNSEYDNQASEELRIASPSGQRLEYVAGLYFYNFNYRLNGDQSGTLGILPFSILLDAPDQHMNQFSYAAFGQATVHVWQGFSLIAGARETRDLLSSTIQFPCVTTYGRCISGLTALGVTNERVDNDNFSYRVGGQYKFNRDDLVYLTYSRGYKGPAINTPFSGDVTPSLVKPEIPLYLELGAKAAFFNRRLVIDASAFHDTIKDFQAQVLDTQAVPSVFKFANASKLVSQGLQFNAFSKPLPGLSIDGGMIYNHAVYGDFLAACTPTFCNGAENVRGQQLANAPRWSANLNGEYDHPLAAGLDGYVSTNVSYRGAVSSDPVPDPNERIKSFTLVNGRVGVRTADGRYGLAIFARNLFDKRFAAIIFPDPVSGGGNYDQAFSKDAFRVIGVSFDVRY
jgi:iron complex outermembrane receptor protein